MPRCFEEDALLRVDALGLSRAEPEESRVEQVDIRDHAAHGDESGLSKADGGTPDASSSSRENCVIDSTPPRRLPQNSPMFFAPGNRPLIPMIAMASLARRLSFRLIDRFLLYFVASAWARRS